jgi:glycosyltransferase involved in cell wall biosynthesis
MAPRATGFATHPAWTPSAPYNPPVPRVGVAIPLYNSAHFIERTLQSLLTQTEQNWKLVVVDDGSPDDSSDVAQRVLDGEPRARVVRQTNAGVARARNVGAGLVDARKLLFLDADDLLLPTALSDLLSVEGAVVTGIFDVVDERDQPIRPIPRFFRDQPIGPIPPRRLLAGPRITPSATLFDTAIFRSAGGWDEEFGQVLEDIHLCLRMSLHGLVLRAPYTVAAYRLHTQQVSQDNEREQRQKLRLIADAELWAAGRPELADAVRHYWRRTLPAERFRGALNGLREGDFRRAAAMAASAAKRLVKG